MDEKKTFKQELKDWWQDNKRVVKVAVTFGVIGIGYGFIKGMCVSNETWIEHSYKQDYEDSGLPDGDDGFKLTEVNCDDPEMLEIVKFENENA